jgi:hypothetical protein
MLDSVRRKSGLCGIMIGGGMAGAILHIGDSLIVAGAVAVVWTITSAIVFFTDQMYEKYNTKWTTVSVGTSVFAIFSLVPIFDSGNPGAVFAIIVGVAMTSYHAGIATVHTRQTVSTETAKQVHDSD